MADIELDNLIIRDFTVVGESIFNQAVAAGEIGENDISFTPYVDDPIIETQLPTEDNGYTWYRLYKSGWVEQGGEVTTSGSLALPIEMSNMHYTATQGIKYTSSSQWSIGSIRPVSTTTVSVNKANGDASWWRVSGVAKIAGEPIFPGQ